jgi:N-acetylmuramic acid 6-phosphate etherase
MLAHKVRWAAPCCLVRITGESPEHARRALAEAEGNIKLAVLLLNGCERQTATRLLENAQGQLRTALQLLRTSR